MTTATLNRDLQKGAAGNDVAILQDNLIKFYGRNHLITYKTFGSATEKMVMRFQNACAITVDGIVGKNTRSYLNELVPHVFNYRSALRRGSKGSAVQYIQARLNDYYLNQLNKPASSGLTCDGDFGLKTEARIRDFQALARLSVDGIVGPQTWKKLETYTFSD